MVRAPGRVNLIGEHTDYNAGLVLPAAIGLATTVTARRRDDGVVAMRSRALGQAELRIDELSSAQGFARYVAGTLAELAAGGVEPVGADVEIAGDLPAGVGLSSSAALCVATALAMLALRDASLSEWEVARVAQRAESRGTGVQCGVMDPFAIVFGEADRALLLDTRTLTYEAVPIPPVVRVLICDSATRRTLDAAPYRRRQDECAQALAALQRRDPAIASLRDVTLDRLDASAGELPDALLRRARHVVGENQRVLAFAAAMRDGDLRRAGEIMAASHRSLRDNFEVSTAGLDALVAAAASCPGVYGARMTGAGFGGCTVNLVAAGAVEQFRRTVPDEYRKRTGRTAVVYDGTPSAGASYQPAA